MLSVKSANKLISTCPVAGNIVQTLFLNSILGLDSHMAHLFHVIPFPLRHSSQYKVSLNVIYAHCMA